MFGWHGALNPEQTAQIAAAKHVIYDGFKEAVAAGVAKDKAGILVDEHRCYRSAANVANSIHCGKPYMCAEP